MKLHAIIKTFATSFFATVMASILLASSAQAECNFFTGWVDNKDGTVTDPRNGLIWKRCAEGFEFEKGVCSGAGREFNWEDAKLTAQQSRFLGQSDWRLPTKEEFEAVMGTSDECQNNDFHNGEYAASNAIAHSADRFWSSSPYVGISDLAWDVNFSNGVVDGNYRVSSYYVRLVRAGQLLGGKAALEFVNEKTDRIRRHQLEQAEKERQRVVEEQQRQIEQAKERKKLATFRKSLREGDDTNCGPVIEVKGKLVKVAFAVANYGNEHWVKRDQILSPDYNCRFVNGQYQSQ